MEPKPQGTILADALLIERVVKRFEIAWRAGETPAVDAFLDSVPAIHRSIAHQRLLAAARRLETEAEKREQAEDSLQATYLHETSEADTQGARSDDYSVGGSAAGTQPAAMPEYLGAFRIDSELGRGAFGVVYQAYDSRLQRKVAIKVPLLDSPVSRQQYIDEARRAAMIEGVGLVPVYHVDVTDNGSPYVVQKFIDGPNLRNLLERVGGLDLETAILVVRAVARALSIAHRHGMIHRDLKPENILLDPQGRPWIADFGLALGEDEQEGRAGEIAGTPLYMSPEQVRGDTDWLDGRTDIWAAGVLLYELIAGRPPFTAKNVERLTREICQRDPKPLSQRRSHVPPELDAVFSRCCAKEVRERYASADELANHLDVVLEQLAAGRAGTARALQTLASGTLPPAADRLATGRADSATAAGPAAENPRLPVAGSAAPPVAPGDGPAAPSPAATPSPATLAQPPAAVERPFAAARRRRATWWFSGSLLVLLAAGAFSLAPRFGQRDRAALAPGEAERGDDSRIKPPGSPAPPPASPNPRPADPLPLPPDPATLAPDAVTLAPDPATLSPDPDVLAPDSVPLAPGPVPPSGPLVEPVDWADLRVNPAAVSPQRPGVFATIAAALSRVESGGQITIAPGFYSESLRITKAVRLRGDGDDRAQVVIESRAGPCATIDGGQLDGQNVTFHGQGVAGQHEFNTIDIRDGAVDLAHCRLTAATFCCVKARRDSRLTVTDCELTALADSAVSCVQSRSVEIVDSTFRDCTDGAAIELIGCGGTIRNSRLLGNNQYGVYCERTGDAPTRIRECRWEGCGQAGIKAAEAGWIEVDGGTLSRCKVSVEAQGGRVTLRDVRAEDGSGPCLSVTRQGILEATDCQFRSCLVGLAMQDAQVSLEGCLIDSMRYMGVYTKSQSQLRLVRCRIERARETGLRLDDTVLQVEAGRVADNGAGGVVCSGARSVVRADRWTIENNSKIGLHLIDGQALWSGGEIAGHDIGVLVDRSDEATRPASLTAEGLRVSDNREAAFQFLAGTEGDLKACKTVGHPPNAALLMSVEASVLTDDACAFE
ncbi:protein kinase domain-containing protein [Roseimaritima sediminicola]|uniref:protein kinase domain-containing protein n=1 Tax=Roseimaritima sediminicola TaxID=2662066 RepID=UPI001298258F|nr:protein kinase [Roseimaritima sediminicola]